MSYFSSLFGLPGLILLLAAVFASLAYQNIELTKELEIAQSETNKCVALSKSLAPPLAMVHVGRVDSQSSQPTGNNAAHHTPNRPSVALDLVQNPSKPASTEPPSAAPPVLTSLQEVFQKKTSTDTQPISTVSPFDTGVWGAGKQ